MSLSDAIYQSCSGFITLDWSVVEYFPHDVSFIVERISWACFVQSFMWWIAFWQAATQRAEIVGFLRATSSNNGFVCVTLFISDTRKKVIEMKSLLLLRAFISYPNRFRNLQALSKCPPTHPCWCFTQDNKCCDERSTTDFDSIPKRSDATEAVETAHEDLRNVERFLWIRSNKSFD